MEHACSLLLKLQKPKVVVENIPPSQLLFFSTLSKKHEGGKLKRNVKKKKNKLFLTKQTNTSFTIHLKKPNSNVKWCRKNILKSISRMTIYKRLCWAIKTTTKTNSTTTSTTTTTKLIPPKKIQRKIWLSRSLWVNRRKRIEIMFFFLTLTISKPRGTTTTLTPISVKKIMNNIWKMMKMTILKFRTNSFQSIDATKKPNFFFFIKIKLTTIVNKCAHWWYFIFGGWK